MVVAGDPTRVPLLLAIEAGVALVALVLCASAFRSEPPTPPSLSAGSVNNVPVTVLQTVSRCLRDPPFLLLTLVPS
jgi:hypothetical protein